MRRGVAGMLALLLVASCATPAGDGGGAPRAAAARPATALAGTRWTGVVEGQPDPRTLPRLEFTEARVAGFTGCNMLSGSWRQENGEVRLGPLATTKRYCVGPEGEVERRFLQAVSPEARVTREGSRLVFTAPSGARFEFDEAAAT
jgi:heat shock protein HslJ